MDDFNKHPDPKCQKYQDEFLKKCSTEEDREFHARMFRYGNVIYRYHERAVQSIDEIPESYYHEWLEGLPYNVRSGMEKRGFEECKTVLSFTRYVNEKNDIGLDEWLKKYLSEEDYQYHKDRSKEINE